MATVTVQDQFVDFAKRSQETVTAAMRTWADSVQHLAGSVISGQPQLPNAKDIVDTTFDFAEHVLATQREFAKSLVTFGTQSAEAAASTLRENTAARK